MRERFLRWAQALAFLGIAVAVSIAISSTSDNYAEKLYQSQHDACLRGNLLREESNRRIESHKADAAVLMDFLNSASAARKASGDHDVAQEYQTLANRLSAVSFSPVTVVNCDEAIPKP